MITSGIQLPVILCGSDRYVLRVPNPDCPRQELHTPCPDGYSQWFDWAGSRHAKGSRASRCPGCRLYVVWSPLSARYAGKEGEQS